MYYNITFELTFTLHMTKNLSIHYYKPGSVEDFLRFDNLSFSYFD